MAVATLQRKARSLDLKDTPARCYFPYLFHLLKFSDQQMLANWQ